MPTGYTADVQSGSVTEFPDFAMQCARAFGALITMREDPSGAVIPDRFEPSNYHAQKLKEVNSELTRLQGLSYDEIRAERDIDEAKRIARRTEFAGNQMAHRARYEAMLNKVNGWTPPSSDHEEMKKFMASQLIESIKFDCTPSSYEDAPIPPALEWYEDQLESVHESISYHEKKHLEELERTEQRNEWMRLLRESIA